MNADPMKLVFLGPPGAGKGTQAKMLAEERELVHISTGEMLRQAVASGSAVGKEVKAILDTGQLVPDSLVVQLIGERIKQADCARGYILDGFPRTVLQAETLTELLNRGKEKLSAVVLFEVSEADLRARLATRREAEQRMDDSAEVQVERLRVYEKQTKPLIDFYERQRMLHRVNAVGTIDEVYSKLAGVVSDVA